MATNSILPYSQLFVDWYALVDWYQFELDFLHLKKI